MNTNERRELILLLDAYGREGHHLYFWMNRILTDGWEAITPEVRAEIEQSLKDWSKVASIPTPDL